MTNMITVAGATGGLGLRVVRALRERGAEVHALIRETSARDQVASLEALGARLVSTGDVDAMKRALDDTACVVSTLSGLRETVVDAQSTLLDAAVHAGVPRFIPSDFAVDFTKLDPGENRNLDLRRAFHERLDQAPIRATSILNGMFADIMASPHAPFFDTQAHRVPYWGSMDQPLDFTTMDDVAAFTARAALDEAAPRVVRICGDRLSPRDLAAVASAVSRKSYAPFRLGSIDELAAKIPEARAADATSETTVFPSFQLMQYLHNMESGRGLLAPLDNARYDGLTWTRVEDLLKTRTDL